MNTELRKVIQIWQLGVVWTVSNAVAFFTGLLLGAILNDNLWPSANVLPGVYILILISHPIQRMLVTGLAVGGFTGLAGWLVLRKHVVISKWWIVASMAGWAIGLVVSESIGAMISNWSIAGAIGAAIIGIAQWSLFRRNTQRSAWWILAWAVSGASVLKWLPPNLSSFVLVEEPISFGIIGLVIGAITGPTLMCLMQPHMHSKSEQIQVGIDKA